MYRDLWLVALSLFLWGIGESAFYSFQPLYLQQLGAAPVTIGLVFSLCGVAGAISHVPAGYLSDRHGRKPMVMAGWIIGLLATGLMSLASELTAFSMGMIIYGSTMFVISPLNSYITAARGKVSVERILTLVSISYNLGAIAGPMIGGAIGDRYGLRMIFIVAFFIFIVSNVTMAFIRPQPVEKMTTSTRLNGLLGNTRYLAFVAVFFLASFSMYLPQPLTPNYLQNERGMSLVEIGRLYGFNATGIVLINLFLGSLNASTGFLVGQVAVGIYCLLLWKVTGFPWYALAFSLLGGFRLARNMAIAQIRSFTHQANMGLAYALAETFNAIAIILAPAIAGYLYGVQPMWIFSTSLALIGISILMTTFFSRTHGKGVADSLA
ncbi:MAG: MFS transporter [Anaerolineales bacterium]|nr:MFS transporter [Anaerolineales bacterium]